VEIVYFVTLNSLGHLAFVGSRMASALFALQLGASPAEVGVVMALFAALPMLLSVFTGRLIDRRGPRRPLLAAFAALACGGALPFLFPRLEALYLSSTVLGIGFMFVHIGMNSVIGAHGSPADRPMNFSWLALSFSISGSLGPLIAGFAIEGLGHADAFLALAVFPAIAFVLLWLNKRALPRPVRPHAPGQHHLLDLLRVPALRRTFLVSGTMAMGWDLYSFLMPIYSTRLGLSAVTIGIIMATFAMATFVVRLAMPVLIRRVRQWRIITASLTVAGTSYLLFPLVASAPLLMAISFVLGLGLGCAQPVIMALLYEAAPEGRQGEAVGIRTTMINASQTFIPLGSGALSLALGMAPVFWLLASGLLGAAWFARRQAASVVVRHQGEDAHR
jgi:MFS family permease